MSIPLAVIAYTILSSGFILMKKGIGWIGHKGPKDRAFRKHFFTWICGFLLINLFIIPNTTALKHLDPHIVSAMAAWGVIVMVFLAHTALKEKLFRSDYFHTLLIVLSIVFLNLFESKETREVVRIPSYIIAAFIPFVLSPTTFIRRTSTRYRTVIFSAVAGMCTGMIVVTMKILVIYFGFQVASYFTSPYFYIYIIFSLATFVTIQIAYKMGYMMAVGPVQYSVTILYPAFCTAFVFGKHFHPIQLVAFVVIVYAVAAMLKKHA